jgi:hypothetical protein
MNHPQILLPCISASPADPSPLHLSITRRSFSPASQHHPQILLACFPASVSVETVIYFQLEKLIHQLQGSRYSLSPIYGLKAVGIATLPAAV